MNVCYSVKSELREDGAESVLNVARVDKADSGNYTCAISAAQRTTVMVHVLDGKFIQRRCRLIILRLAVVPISMKGSRKPASDRSSRP